MNRRTRTLLPTTGSLLEPRTLSSSNEREKPKDVQKWKARYYNADAHDLPELNEVDTVRLKPFVLGQKEWKKGVVVKRLDERSYEVETADISSYRRNSAHLKKTNKSRPETTSGESQQIPDRRTSKLPAEETFTEPTRMSSCPDEPDGPSPTVCEYSSETDRLGFLAKHHSISGIRNQESGTKGLPCIEPYTKSRESRTQ